MFLKIIRYISLSLFVLAFIMIGLAVYLIIFRPDLTGIGRPYEQARESIIAISTGATVVATLLLAYATFELAHQSTEQGKTYIKTEKEKEERDRKERLLDEIVDWAEAVVNSAIGRQTKDPHELWKTKLDYNSILQSR